jgi:hypothetical protein
MKFTQFSYDMEIIGKLSDTPNVDDGLTAAQLKEKFDEGGKAVKDYLNGELLPELGALSLTAMLAEGPMIVSEHQLCTTLPAAGVKNRIMFKKV